jgi:hypothetical protein
MCSDNKFAHLKSFCVLLKNPDIRLYPYPRNIINIVGFTGWNCILIVHDTFNQTLMQPAVRSRRPVDCWHGFGQCFL